MDYARALQFVVEEKRKIEDSCRELRQQVQRARRNYEMKYDDPYDTVTRKRKIFVPLTKQEVDLVSPRFDLDPNSIVIDSLDPGFDRKALIWQELMRNVFSDMEWQYRMKPQMIPFVNEGQMVTEMLWDAENNKVDFMVHDIKDFYIFPKEPSIEQASAFGIKRRILREHFLADEQYKNKGKVAYSSDVSDGSAYSNARTMQYEIGKSQYNTELEEVELYERRGWFPKSIMTGNAKDDDELVDGLIVVAGRDGRESSVVLISDKNDKWRFAEAWYLKRPYLWFGLGLGVSMRDYQFYYNKIVNRRDNNEDVLHHGMFVKRRGMNVDARQRMTGAGIWIEADNPADLTQLRTQDVTQSSYTGEENLLNAVQRLNGTADILRGTGTVYSASEAAIKDKNIGTRLNDPQVHLGRMFHRCVQAAMRLMRENATKGMVVKMTGRDDELATFDDFKLTTINKARADEGQQPISKEEFQAAMQKFGGKRYLSVPTMSFLKGDFKVKIDNDASLIKNKAGMAQNILDAMKIASQMPSVVQSVDFADLFEQWMNMQGLKVKRMEAQPPAPVPNQAQPGAPATQQAVPNAAPDVQAALASMGATRAG